MTTDFQTRVFDACSRIPVGRVSTYADIARAVGKPGSFRAVGNALNKNRSKLVPCHRVVKSDGSVGGFAHGQERKIAMLRSEGVTVTGGLVEDFQKVRKKN